MKRLICLILALLIFTACGAGGQALVSDPEPESGPSLGSESSSGASRKWETLEEKRAREGRLFSDIYDHFYDELPKESYSYYTERLDPKSQEIILRIGVTDEAALDAYLADWTGERWDRLVKEPARVSQARQEQFADAAQELEIDPAIYFIANPGDGFFDAGEKGKIFVTCMMTDPDASAEEMALWAEAPSALWELAAEMAIPEDMIQYQAPDPWREPCVPWRYDHG